MLITEIGMKKRLVKLLFRDNTPKVCGKLVVYERIVSHTIP